MLSSSFAILIVATIVFVSLAGAFLNAVKREAPNLYETWGSPTVGGYLWRKKILMPFSGLVLFREYRTQLAQYPHSRAWASWLFVAHWVQLGALALFIVSIVLGARHDF